MHSHKSGQKRQAPRVLLGSRNNIHPSIAETPSLGIHQAESHDPWPHSERIVKGIFTPSRLPSDPDSESSKRCCCCHLIVSAHLLLPFSSAPFFLEHHPLGSLRFRHISPCALVEIDPYDWLANHLFKFSALSSGSTSLDHGLSVARQQLHLSSQRICQGCINQSHIPLFF